MTISNQVIYIILFLLKKFVTWVNKRMSNLLQTCALSIYFFLLVELNKNDKHRSFLNRFINKKIQLYLCLHENVFFKYLLSVNSDKFKIVSFVNIYYSSITKLVYLTEVYKKKTS